MSRKPHSRMERAARDLLAASGLPWDIETGSKHLKVRIAGRMEMVLARSCSKKNFDMLEVEKAIRRAKTRTMA